MASNSNSSFQLPSFPIENIRFAVNEVPSSDYFDDFEEEHQSNPAPQIVNMSRVEGQQRFKKFLSTEDRKLVYEALLERSVNGKLKRNTTTEVSTLLSVPLRTIQRVWKQGKDTPNGIAIDVSVNRKGRCGRKRVEFDLTRIKDVPLNRRSTLRSLAQALDMNHVTLHSRVKEGKLRRHSNAIKPHLKEENKIARLRFCISMLDRCIPSEPNFFGMYNIVHIDEKWFYMTKKSKSYYMLPDEPDPLRSCQSKNFIGKVMFLAAIACPRFDDEGNETFSGKIGVFPFVSMQPALRRSRNREAGTMETKAITSVKKETIRSMLLEKVIPAIQAKWPREELGNTIFIQQDNARTHVQPDDESFQEAASQNGFDVRLFCQPANSPDLNVLDLGFFNAIQSLQDKECTRTVDDLIAAIQRAFDEYPTKKINHVFLSLQLCMRATMKVGGSNDYKIPHENKARLERAGNLPKQIHVDYELVEETMNILS